MPLLITLAKLFIFLIDYNAIQSIVNIEYYTLRFLLNIILASCIICKRLFLMSDLILSRYIH